MGYRRALITRWSRRDRLAVLVVAVTVGFLVGTALLVVAGGAQTASLASDFDAQAGATYLDDPDRANELADTDALVLTLAAVEGPDGRTLAVGVPDGTDREFGDRGRAITRGDETTLGGLAEPTEHELVGTEGSTNIAVETRGESVFPDEWYVTEPSVVEELGSTGALVIDSSEADGSSTARESTTEKPTTTVPLRSALAFFATGTEDALRLLGVLVGASGLLVAVTVYSVTRMSVTDRSRAIAVIRSTGGAPGSILGSFAVRAALLSGVGAAAGYAIGVIGVSAAVNAAVVSGLPTSLSPRVTAETAPILLGIVGTVPIIGAIAGAAAAWPAVRTPPAHVGRRNSSPFDTLSPRLLDARVLVPTTATLAAFAAFALLFLAGVGAIGPLVGGGEAVVTESGTSNPINSQVPEGYVDAFDEQGIDASAEILLFAVVDDRPVQARGAEFDAFASVSDAELVSGSEPSAVDEAVVGTEAARTLGVEPGDELPLGGSTRVGTTRVTVVGTFDAPTPYGDYVLVSLPTARHLTGVGDGNVNLIRGAKMPAFETDRGVSVTDLDVDDPVVAGEPVDVTVRLTNEGIAEATESVTVTVADQERTFEVTLDGASETSESVSFDPVDADELTVRAGNETRTLSVVDAGSIRLSDVPAEAPLHSEPRIRVVDVRGEPVENATVTVENRTVRTDADGSVRVPLTSAGEHELIAEHDGNTAATTVSVDPNVSKAPVAELSMPSTVDLLVRPTATLRISNPWNTTLTVETALRGPGGETRRPVTVAPGETATVDRQLDRNPVGEYNVSARLDGERIAEQRYRVTGDERVAAALASRGVQQESPFEQAIETAFGNVQLLGATLIGLAGLMAIGATTASFAGAVHARRETLGVRRAVGASPIGIVWLVLKDAFKLGLVAAVFGTVLALAALWLLDFAGLLGVFGIRLLGGVRPSAVIVVITAALGIALLGAVTATLAALSVSPAALLSGRSSAEEDGGFDA